MTAITVRASEALKTHISDIAEYIIKDYDVSFSSTRAPKQFDQYTKDSFGLTDDWGTHTTTITAPEWEVSYDYHEGLVNLKDITAEEFLKTHPQDERELHRLIVEEDVIGNGFNVKNDVVIIRVGNTVSMDSGLVWVTDTTIKTHQGCPSKMLLAVKKFIGN